MTKTTVVVLDFASEIINIRATVIAMAGVMSNAK